MTSKLNLFLNRRFENKISMKMLDYDYEFPKEEVCDFIKGILSIPIKSIVDDIINNQPLLSIDKKDVFQFSQLNKATFILCDKLNNIDDPGVNWFEAGKLLLDDGKERKDGAIIKYGENHLKTGEMLGLIHDIENVYFLTCIGKCSQYLNDDEKNKLLCRLVLRNKLIRQMILKSSKGKLVGNKYFDFLAPSTYTRRRSNIRRILSVLYECDEYDFSEFLNNILL